MSFLTILFALLGFTVDFQPNTTPMPNVGTQTEMGGAIEIGGMQGNAQPSQDGVLGDGGEQGGAQAEHGGFIIVNG